MRIDVREFTGAAARAEREHNGIFLSLVAPEYAEKLQQGWSEPLEVKAELDPHGLLTLIFRRPEAK